MGLKIISQVMYNSTAHIDLGWGGGGGGSSPLPAGLPTQAAVSVGLRVLIVSHEYWLYSNVLIYLSWVCVLSYM